MIKLDFAVIPRSGLLVAQPGSLMRVCRVNPVPLVPHRSHIMQVTSFYGDAKSW